MGLRCIAHFKPWVRDDVLLPYFLRSIKTSEIAHPITILIFFSLNSYMKDAISRALISSTAQGLSKCWSSTWWKVYSWNLGPKQTILPIIFSANSYTTESQTPACWSIKSENSLVQSARQDRNTSHTASMLALSLSIYMYMLWNMLSIYLFHQRNIYSMLEKLMQFSRWAQPWSVGWCKVLLWSAAYW